MILLKSWFIESNEFVQIYSQSVYSPSVIVSGLEGLASTTKVTHIKLIRSQDKPTLDPSILVKIVIENNF